MRENAAGNRCMRFHTFDFKTNGLKRMVPGAGLEPARLAAGDFESPTSTNFITRAGELPENLYLDIVSPTRWTEPGFCRINVDGENEYYDRFAVFAQ